MLPAMSLLALAPVLAPGTLSERAHAALGLVGFLLLTFVIGRLYGAKRFPTRVVVWGVILAFAFGAFVIYLPGLLEAVQALIQDVLDFTVDGAKLVFGEPLVKNAMPVFDETGKIIGTGRPLAFFGFVVLPTIIFVSMLTAMLYHLKVLTWVVHGLAWLMQKSMGTSGAETLSTAANIFVGQTEAPLLVKPFLATATPSELMAIMLGGFANIASGVLVVYADLLKDFVTNAGGHLAAACFVSAPATLIVSKLIVPETEIAPTAGGVKFDVEKIDSNLIDSATRGTSEGVALAINVGAMLISFTAFVSLLNALIGWAFNKAGLHGVTMQLGLGYICAPITWLCGVPWHDCTHAGSLLGIKTVLNEFIAYNEMSQHLHADPNYLSPRSCLLMTYALCGFANFASVGIQIGGISVMAPNRRHELSRLGLMAMLGGAIASCIGACVVGVLV